MTNADAHGDRKTPAIASTSPLSPPASSRRDVWGRIWSGFQFLLALGFTVSVLAYLLFAPHSPGAETAASSTTVASRPIVEIVGQQLLRVQPGSPFDDKLQIETVRSEQLTDPLLKVTGRVAASLRLSDTSGKRSWQFEAAEMLNAYADWEKAQADITFAETQLVQVTELANARVTAQSSVVERLKKLVEVGTDSFKDLAADETNLLQYRITGKKEIHEAESFLRIARTAGAVTARQLQQGGLEPDLLRTSTGDVDIVMADVPEGRSTQAKIGQACICHFYGFPQQDFFGKLTSIAPVMSRERRSLRVLVVIDDPGDLLRPGMFAEIGLGTDPRDAMLMPADGVLHVARTDYVLAAEGENTWRVTAVQVGELHNGNVEILDGLKTGMQVLGKGAILLKPLVIGSLQMAVKAPSIADAGRKEISP